MKISELIAELQDALEKHGDLSVVRSPCEGEGSGDIEIEDVKVWPNESNESFLEVYLS